jgi:hypothetical protein
LTITEGGYAEPADGSPSAFSYIVSALLLRRGRGIPPFTVVSCDNVEANGQVDRITPVTTDKNRMLVARANGVADRWPPVAEPADGDGFVDGGQGLLAAAKTRQTIGLVVQAIVAGGLVVGLRGPQSTIRRQPREDPPHCVATRGPRAGRRRLDGRWQVPPQ